MRPATLYDSVATSKLGRAEHAENHALLGSVA